MTEEMNRAVGWCRLWARAKSVYAARAVDAIADFRVGDGRPGVLDAIVLHNKAEGRWCDAVDRALGLAIREIESETEVMRAQLEAAQRRRRGKDHDA